MLKLFEFIITFVNVDVNVKEPDWKILLLIIEFDVLSDVVKSPLNLLPDIILFVRVVAEKLPEDIKSLFINDITLDELKLP
jgi:hypothetical protein